MNDIMHKVVEYLKNFIGRPYIWGGDGTGAKSGGFDCSGLILEGLCAFGAYSGGDTTADGLRLWAGRNGWKSVKRGEVEEGDLVFFGSSKATHIAISIGDGLILEAGGGSSSCTKFENSTGYVRIRPLSRRKDFLVAYRFK